MTPKPAQKAIEDDIEIIREALNELHWREIAAKKALRRIEQALSRPISEDLGEIEGLSDALEELEDFEWDRMGVMVNTARRDYPKCTCNASCCELCTALNTKELADKYIPILREAARRYSLLSGKGATPDPKSMKDRLAYLIDSACRDFSYPVKLEDDQARYVAGKVVEYIQDQVIRSKP